MTAITVAPRPAWRDRHPKLFSSATATIVAGLSGLFGWASALAGLKGALAALLCLLFVSALIVFKPREEIILGTAVLSIAALFHKSFGTPAAISSGPVSVYISSFDVMIGLLWFSWFVMDPYGMARDLRLALRRPILYLPVVAGALMLPSVVGATNAALAIAELVRMTSMYFLFVYFAIRIRTRVHVWIVLGTLGAIGVFETVIVLGQKFTKSTLGLSVFGTPSILHDRGDGIFVARPFGTMTHPVFMGAFMGAIAIVAYSLAVNLRPWRQRLLWLGVAGIASVPLAISDTRAAALGIVAAFVVTTITFMLTGRLTARVVGTAFVIVIVALIPAWPYVSKLYNESLHSSHFSVEWKSRMQLNAIAIRMFEDEPFIGHGLNNFEQDMDHYDTYGLIFAGNPVHNLYLLQLAETGIVGFAGMLILGIGIFLTAIRLARARDRLMSAVGFGVAGALVFWFFEEMLVFSLRQDHPRAMFFMLAGLVVACSRIAGTERPPRISGARLLPPLPVTPSGNGTHAASNGNGSRNGTRPRGYENGARNGNGRSGRPARRIRWTAPRARTRRPALHMTRADRLRRQIARRRRARRLTTIVLGLSVAFTGMAALGSYVVATGNAIAAAGNTSGLRIVFQAVPRNGDGHRAIYTANGDGTNVQRITPADGRDYSWVSYADGGNKIVYTSRPAQAVGDTEEIYLADPDGSHVQQLTTNAWRNAQPSVSPDGRTLVFTSRWNEFRDVALYSLDLATLQVRNLSAVTQPGGAVDADPRFTADGKQIVFAASKLNSDGSLRPTEVALINADGTNRRLVTRDSYYDTDPALSPDGKNVAIASYRGSGSPQEAGGGPFQVKLHDFHLVDRSLTTGAEQVLTDGLDCSTRADAAACSPTEAPAYAPSWTPDGAAIGYVGVLSNTRTCICLSDPATGGARVVLASTDLAISWFRWVAPGPVPATAVTNPGADAPTSRLLFTGISAFGTPILAASGPDRWDQLALQPATYPGTARWTPDHKTIVGSVTVDASKLHGGPPPAPPGEYRHRHYTLDSVSSAFDPPIKRTLGQSEQIMVMNGVGANAHLVTSPWTEDWRDAIPDGEVHGNTTPDISSDGRYIVFTNLSTSTLESAILRMDLQTGEVLNLTNATAGAMPVADFQPRFSADGKNVAFATSTNASSQIAVVDRDGYGYRTLTNDSYINVSPTWAPDGRSIVYASYRGKTPFTFSLEDPMAKQGQIPKSGWALVRVDVATGKQTVLTPPATSPVFSPVYSPDGSQIAFISVSPPGQPDIYVVGANGGTPRPLQVTQLTNELFVDWK